LASGDKLADEIRRHFVLSTRSTVKASSSSSGGEAIE